jgi:hypothetical protein
MRTSAGLGGHSAKRSTIIRRGGRGVGGNNFSIICDGSRGGAGGGLSRITFEKKNL